MLLLADPALKAPVECLPDRAETFPTLGSMATCSRKICALPTGQEKKIIISRKSAEGRSQIILSTETFHNYDKHPKTGKS